MITDRANAICLLEILREYSDSNHILGMKDIISKMNTLYGIHPDRRTIYSAAALLIDLGYDISMYEENGIGYYLRGRELEQSEVILLTDAVYSFPFIPAKQSEDLIRKLQKQLSVNQRKQYRHLTVVRQDKKTDNRQVFFNIEQLDEAITAGKQVQFTYMQYGLDKKLYPRREKPYTANAYGMVYMNEHYYLICSLASFPKIALYRIDRMRDLKILDIDCAKQIESEKATADAIYGFAGEPEHIVMHCDKLVLNDVIDKFGSEVHLSELDENHFSASFDVPPHGVKFWALQYLPYVEVVSPEWLRKDIIQCVCDNPYLEVKQ